MPGYSKNNNVLMLRIVAFVVIGLYIALHLWLLPDFPFVHSDEPWLSGLTRNMAQSSSLSVTETFFDLKPRNPHAIKTLFHMIQMGFMSVGGYQIVTFRLLSLICGLLVLALMYKSLLVSQLSPKVAFLSTALLAVDIQFIYASHFARQEAVLLLFLMIAYVYYQQVDFTKTHQAVILGMILGLSIGIHPNSFIICLPFGLLFAYDVFVTKKIPLTRGILTGAIIAGCAILVVLISLSFDGNFFQNYLAYGSEFDVEAPLSSKLAGLPLFYTKLFYGVSGTYYTPDIRLQFILFGLFLLVALWMMLKLPGAYNRLIHPLLMIAGINLGYIIVGRYNPTSVVFQFPFFYMLVALTLSQLRPGLYKGAMALLLSALVFFSGLAILRSPVQRGDYREYLDNIAASVPFNARVLANLNAEYYFDNGALHDYRNLAYLQGNNMNFQDYIEQYQIEYIIVPEEMSYIYENRPSWNGIYGNPSYYEDMMDFVQNHCLEVHRFESPYGMRIVRLMNQQPWRLVIYKVMP